MPAPSVGGNEPQGVQDHVIAAVLPRRRSRRLWGSSLAIRRVLGKQFSNSGFGPQGVSARRHHIDTAGSYPLAAKGLRRVLGFRSAPVHGPPSRFHDDLSHPSAGGTDLSSRRLWPSHPCGVNRITPLSLAKGKTSAVFACHASAGDCVTALVQYLTILSIARGPNGTNQCQNRRAAEA